MTHLVIFQIRNEPAERPWVAYCRETAPTKQLATVNEWARKQAARFERDSGSPIRWYIQLCK